MTTSTYSPKYSPILLYCPIILWKTKYAFYGACNQNSTCQFLLQTIATPSTVPNWYQKDASQTHLQTNAQLPQSNINTEKTNTTAQFFFRSIMVHLCYCHWFLRNLHVWYMFHNMIELVISLILRKPEKNINLFSGSADLMWASSLGIQVVLLLSDTEPLVQRACAVFFGRRRLVVPMFSFVMCYGRCKGCRI